MDWPTHTQVETRSGRGTATQAEGLSDSQTDRPEGHSGNPKTKGSSLEAARRD